MTDLFFIVNYCVYCVYRVIAFFAFVAFIAFVKFNASHWNLDPLCGSGIEYRRAVLEVSRLCD